MQRSTARALALTASPAVILLAACSAGLSNPELDACNSVAVWIDSGQVPEWFEGALTDAQDALADVEDTPLAGPLAELALSAESDRAPTAEAYMTACEEHGWVPSEG